jgi:lipoate-protein ligase A
MMKFLDLTFSTPAENLAADEALLDWREQDGGGGILRFWESPEIFVVVGYANKIEAEVNVANCGVDKIPIFRRCSGGGTILQGPGCLNYALILEITGNAALANITITNQYIMERNRRALQAAVEDSNTVKVQGHTDLACGNASELSPHQELAKDSGWKDSPSPPPSPAGGGRMVRPSNSKAPMKEFRKFSGNSQRRHKSYLLFHGTFLLDFDLTLINKYLKFPSRQPEYRVNRSHGDFLMNLNLPAEVVKAAMREQWQAEEALQNLPLENIFKLAHEKYATREWNMRF